MNDDDMCPNCVTPWKCNGPHVPSERETGVRGWDYVEGCPTLQATFPLFEDDHGMRCAACNRVVERGQPYVSIPTGVYEDGDTVNELRCVYCATGTAQSKDQSDACEKRTYQQEKSS